MNVFLIGFMGSGKSTIGKKLAKRLDYQFLDLDRYIEDKTQQTIPSIFETQGETAFRTLETKVLKALNVSNTVVALGGGTPCFNQNMNIINELGVSVYLKLPVSVLVNRLMNAKTKRPLIEAYKHDKNELNQQVESLLLEREVHYQSANIVFEADNMNPDKYSQLEDEIEGYFFNLLDIPSIKS